MLQYFQGLEIFRKQVIKSSKRNLKKSFLLHCGQIYSEEMETNFMYLAQKIIKILTEEIVPFKQYIFGERRF